MISAKRSAYSGSTSGPTAALRLEALPDPRLPAGGPGMTYYEGTKGDFYLTEFSVRVDGEPVGLTGAMGEFAKNSFRDLPARAALAEMLPPEPGDPDRTMLRHLRLTAGQVAEVAAALAELPSVTDEPAPVDTIAGVRPWVRAFRHAWVEHRPAERASGPDRADQVDLHTVEIPADAGAADIAATLTLIAQQQPARLLLDAELAQPRAGIVVGDAGREARVDRRDAANVDEEADQLERARRKVARRGAVGRSFIEQQGIVLLQHAGAGAGRHDDIVEAGEGIEQAARNRPRPGTVAGIIGRLAAAGLTFRHLADAARAFKQLACRKSHGWAE